MRTVTKRMTAILGAGAAALGAYEFFVRPWHRRWGVAESELHKGYPGDDLLPDASETITHAITIAAPPAQIWPWLMQIGQDRGGFYSYTPLENLFGCDMPRVEQLVSDWPDRHVGEVVWFATPRHFGAKAYMEAAIVERNHAFVLFANAELAAQHVSTWGFFLEPRNDRATRLIVRARSAPPRGIAGNVAAHCFWDPAHFLMERKMLLKIKALAEHAPVAVSPRHVA